MASPNGILGFVVDLHMAEWLVQMAYWGLLWTYTPLNRNFNGNISNDLYVPIFFRHTQVNKYPDHSFTLYHVSQQLCSPNDNFFPTISYNVCIYVFKVVTIATFYLHLMNWKLETLSSKQYFLFWDEGLGG